MILDIKYSYIVIDHINTFRGSLFDSIPMQVQSNFMLFARRVVSLLCTATASS